LARCAECGNFLKKEKHSYSSQFPIISDLQGLPKTYTYYCPICGWKQGEPISRSSGRNEPQHTSPPYEPSGSSSSSLIELFLILILVAVIVYAFVIQPFINSLTHSSQPNQAFNSTTTNVSSSASNVVNPASCPQITDNNARDACYFNAALQTSNDQYCGSIAETSTIDPYPQGWCYTKVAMQNRDPSGCQKIGQAYFTDKCYYQLAVELKDSSLCSKIIDSSTKSGCLSNS